MTAGPHKPDAVRRDRLRLPVAARLKEPAMQIRLVSELCPGDIVERRYNGRTTGRLTVVSLYPAGAPGSSSALGPWVLLHDIERNRFDTPSDIDLANGRIALFRD